MSNTLSVGKSDQFSVPVGWEQVRIGDICQEDKRAVDPVSVVASGLPYLSLEHLEANTGRICQTEDELKEREVKSNSFLFGTQHVLYGKLRPYLNKVALPSFQGRCTTEIVPLLPNNAVTREWLAWSLRNQRVVRAVSDQATGTRMPRANMRVLMEIRVPLPPIREQRRILAALDERMQHIADAKRALDAQQEAAGALRGALIREMIPADSDTLPDGWRWERLGDVCQPINLARPKDEAPESTFKYIELSSIDRHRKRISSHKELRGSVAPSRARQIMAADDVLVATVSPDLNQVAMVPVDFHGEICSTGFTVLRADDRQLDAAFLFAVVQTRRFVGALASLAKGSVYPAVTDRIVKSQLIPVPPFEEQKRIARFVSEAAEEAEGARDFLIEDIRLLQELKQAYLAVALTGAI